MSTITVTNIKATGETASRSATGVAAAWCNWDGTGTPSIRDSVNCASLTDEGTGIYSVNFSNNMSNDDYSAVSAGRYTGTGTGISLSLSPDASVTGSAIETGKIGLYAAPDYSQSKTDNDLCCVTIHGDLA